MRPAEPEGAWAAPDEALPLTVRFRNRDRMPDLLDGSSVRDPDGPSGPDLLTEGLDHSTF
ncbi:hypothetical protein GCM10010253_36720 [Streptomyces badius]|uniref:Uncharacterized protein n=1 Tax=Streptomyces badius TaxID=1941 RepID=A0ABQ2T8V6_STRBA|nr:hypothetical protein GCM10010253_36720 [Streptomyces badius]